MVDGDVVGSKASKDVPFLDLVVEDKIRADLQQKRVNTVTCYATQGDSQGLLAGNSTTDGGVFQHINESSVFKIKSVLDELGIEVHKEDLIYELGAGDGSVGWALAEVFDAKVVNIEITTTPTLAQVLVPRSF
jgi:hypothetical protein